MPPKRYYRKKRTYRKKRRYTRRTKGPFIVNNSKQLITADKMITKLRYIGIDTPNFPVSVGATSQTSYRLNGLYDPSPSVVSTSVPGFAEWTQLYDAYLPLKAYIKLTCMNTYTIPMYFGFLVQNPQFPLVFSSWSSFRETLGNKYSIQKFVAPAGSGNTKATMSMLVDFGQLIGDSKLYRSNLNFRGTITSNPLLIFELIVYALAGDGTTAIASTIPFELTITWINEFYERQYEF